jgi:nitrite reductase/ring-hydroxylating ferredoxin subunit
VEFEITAAKALTPGTMTAVVLNNISLLIANVNGEYYAMGDICTHMGCNISDGELKGETVECPCHGSVFNVKTGAVVNGPAGKAELSFPLTVYGDKIMVDI